MKYVQSVKAWKFNHVDRDTGLRAIRVPGRTDGHAPPPAVALVRGMRSQTSVQTFGILKALVEGPGRHGVALFLHGHPKGQNGDNAERWLTRERRLTWWNEARDRGMACVALQAPDLLGGTERSGWDDDMRTLLVEAAQAVVAEYGPIAVVVGFSDGASEAAYLCGTLGLPGCVVVGAPGVQGFDATAWRHQPHVAAISDTADVVRDGRGGHLTMPQYLDVMADRTGIARDRLHGEVGGEGHTMPPRLARWALDCAMGYPRPVWPWETRAGW